MAEAGGLLGPRKGDYETLLSGRAKVKGDDISGEDEDLAITLSGDAYDAVVGAAFGAIRIALPSSQDGQKQYVRLHPFFILCFCITLFAVQLSCLSCIILNMDLTNVWTRGNEHSEKHPDYSKKHDSWESFDSDPEQQMKLTMRTIMVGVLQMIGIKELLGSLKPICLVMNYVTWFELERPPSKGGFAWTFHAAICMPICLVAQMLQLGVVYAVLIVSMSVIIEAKDVKEIVFNGLVVMFLGDLDEYAWVAMSAVFNMDKKFFDDYRFRLRKDLEVVKARKSAIERHEKLTPLNREYWAYWLYRGQGGKATVLENLLVFFALIYIYIRQAFMYVQAIHTGILPVAHDVCSLYRGLTQPGQPFAAATLSIVDFFTLIDYEAMLRHTVKRGNLEYACLHNDDYMSDPFSHASTYLSWWPKNVGLALAGICILFGVPQLLYANFQKVLRLVGNNFLPVVSDDGEVTEPLSP